MSGAGRQVERPAGASGEPAARRSGHPAAGRSARPSAGVFVRALVRTRVAAPAYAAQVLLAAGLGALAGHTAAAASLAGAGTSALVRNFEAYTATLAILAGGLEALMRLAAPAAAQWLRPLFARRLAREAYPLGVLLGTTLAWAFLWTAAAAAYRVGGGIAGVWDPGAALARLPAVWASVLAAGCYGAASAALARSRPAALGLAVAYPMACFLLVVRWVTAHPDAEAAPALLRAPLLLFPPLQAHPTIEWALRYGAYGAVVLALLVLSSDRWVGRVS
ncbi:MAG: hypothetical protein WEB88_04945 [Gemmatimonadota bacterium]